jgi:hypothetical protein
MRATSTHMDVACSAQAGENRGWCDLDEVALVMDSE